MLTASRLLGGLDDDEAVRALAARGHEEMMEVLGGSLRVEGQDGALELLAADGLGDVP